MSDLKGYADPKYALSLREFGEPRELPRCGGWIIVRPISGTPYKDAIGCYPLFACRDWTKLHEDLEHAGSDLVSLVLVADPMSRVDPGYLEQYFDLVYPFKTHYVADLSHPLRSFVGKVHRKNARQSLEIMDVEVFAEPVRYLDEWENLYDNLIRRHSIRGISAFSPRCFEIQLTIPGMRMFLGRREGKIIGAALILLREHVAHFHLSACTNEGYKIGAAYGLHWQALVYGYEHEIRFFHLGGAAGIKDNTSDGLAQFKRGWSNDRRAVYFCGRVFDRQTYDALCRRQTIMDSDYFPAYRAPSSVL